jgi:sugar lactone lactonase YvrE
VRKLLKSWKLNHKRDDRRSGRQTKQRCRPWLEALEERIEPAPIWNFFPTPVPSFGAGGGAGGGVNDITVGPDGAIWYTADWTVTPSAGANQVTEDFVGRLASDGSTTQFSVPGIASGIFTGPDGNLWFTSRQQNDPFPNTSTLYRMTPQGQLTPFPAPNGSIVGPDGNIWWMPAQGGIGKMTTGGQITVYYLPANDVVTNLVAGSDGNVWFTYRLNAAPPRSMGVGSVTPGGAIRFIYAFPTGAVVPGDFEVATAPPYSCLGPDGNVWILSQNRLSQNRGSNPWLLNRITPAGVVTTFNLPLENVNNEPSVGLYGTLVAGPDGNLWLEGSLLDAGSPGGPETFWQALTVVNTNGDVVAEYPSPIRSLLKGADGNIYGVAYDSSTLRPSIGQLILPVAGPVSQLSVTASSQNATVGTPFSVTVRALDPSGATDTSYQGTVHFRISQYSEDNVPADYAFTAQDQGVHTFTGFDFRVSGQREIMVTDASTGVMGATNVMISPGPAVAIVLTARTGNSESGCPLSVQVEALDAYGNAATSYMGTVHFTSNDPLAQLPSDYTFTTSDQGVHSFNVNFGTIGSEQLTVNDGTLSDSNTYANESAIFSGDFEAAIDTNNIVAGTPFDLTVVAMTDPLDFPGDRLTDTAYRGTIHFLSNDPSATLPKDYTFTAADLGVHTFQVVLRTVNTAPGTTLWIEDDALGLQGTDGGNPVITGLPFGEGIPDYFLLGPAPFAKLDVKAPVAPVAGAPFILSVTAEDAYGNIVPYYDSVAFSSSDGSAVLPSAYQFQASDAGVHTFTSLVLNSAGLQTIQVTDPRFGISGTITLDVQPGPAPPPPPPPAINTFNPSGIIINSLAAGSDGALWGAGGAAALSRITTNGQVSIVSIPGPGTGYITVGPDGNLYVSEPPLGTVTVFNPVTQTGTYLNQFFPWNAVIGADGNFWGGGSLGVALTPSSQPAIARETLDGQINEFPTGNGWHDGIGATSDWTPGPDGSIWFTYAPTSGDVFFVATGIGCITPQGTIKTFAVPGFPASGPLPTTVDHLAVGRDGNLWFFRDENGNEVIDRMTPDGTITQFPLPTLPPLISVGPGLLSGPDGNLWSWTIDAANTPGFVPSFVRITTSGAVTLYAESVPEPKGFNAATVGPDGNLWFGEVVYPSTMLEQIVLPPEGPAASLTVSTVHARTGAGAPFAVTVRALDANGMQVVGYRGTVHFSSSDTLAGLPADYAFTAADQGVHTFIDLRLDAAGSETISVSDSSAGISGSASLSVQPGPATLVLQVAPAVDAYHSFQMTVTVADAFGNRITSYTGTVHFACVDVAAILPTDYTFTSADQGVHTFTAVLGTPGTDFLTVSDTSGQFPGTTIPITVNPGIASYIVTAPSTVGIGQPFNLTVKVVDGSGNLLTDYRGIVTFDSFVTINNLQYGNSPTGLVDYQFSAADAGIQTFSTSFTVGPVFADGGLANTDEIDMVDANNSALKGSISITVTPVPIPTWIHTYPFAAFVSQLVTGDGALWGVTGSLAGVTYVPETVYRITPDGAYTSFQAVGTEGAAPAAYAFGPDGNLWIDNSGYITRVTPQGGVTNFPINPSHISGDMILGPDGNMWFSWANNVIARMTMSGQTTYFTLPFDPTVTSLQRLAVGPDGNIWFTTLALNYPGPTYVGKMTLQGAVTLFPCFGSLWGLTSGPDGNLWSFSFSSTAGNAHLVRISPDGQFTEYPIAFNPQGWALTPDYFGLTAGPDGNLWMALNQAGIDGGGLLEVSTSGVESIYQLDTTPVASGGGIRYWRVVTGPDGNVWFLATTGSGYQLVQAVLPSAGAAARFAVSAADIAPTAGSAFAVTVRVVDANGRQVVGYRGTVHFSTSAQQAGLPANYTFTATDQGIHTFIGVNLDTAGADSVTVQDTTSGINGTTSVNVQPGSLAELVLRGGVTVLIGQPIQVSVSAADAFGNAVQTFIGTVHFSSSDASAGLPPDYTFTASDKGTHTFSVSFNTAGAQSIKVSDSADNLGSGSLSAIVIGSLKIAAPLSVQAGQIFTVTVMAVDKSNNPVSAYVGIIHFSSSDQQAGLPTDYHFTAADAGVHTFQGIFLGTSGTDQIAIVDKSNASATASASTAVSAGSLASLAVSTSTGAIAGTPFSLTVAAFDRFHNAVTGYSGTVTITTGDPKGIVPGVYQFQASDHGIHTFTGIVLKTAGLQTVTATDSGAGVHKQTSVQVAPAAASELHVNSAANITAGMALGVTITLLDPYDNVAIGYRGTVHFTSSDTGAILPADYKFTLADSGVHTFTGIQLHTAGTETIALIDTVTSTLKASASVTVSPAAASRTAVRTNMSMTAGTVVPLTVTMFDPYGNIASAYRGTLHFTSSDTQAAVPADYTFTAIDNGVHTFAAIQLDTAGAQTVKLSDTATSALTTSASITVFPAAAGREAINVAASVTAGAALPLTVTLFDPYGNIASGYLGKLHFTSTDPEASMPADYTFQAGDKGVHTFSTVLLKMAGSQSVTVADASSSIPAVKANITVNPAAASHYTLTVPVHAQVGTSTSITISAFDPYGNKATSYAGTLHFASTDLHAGLPANYSYGPLDQGSHTFSVVFHALGNQSLSVSDLSNSSLQATSQKTLVTANDWVTGADAGGGPEVKLFDATTGKGKLDFMAYSPYFTGGVRVALGDIYNTGIPDIITVPGPTGGPDVRIFDGTSGQRVFEFMAFDPHFTGGLFVTVADFNGDGYADIAIGADAGGGPQVKIFSGKGIASGSVQVLASFYAYSPYFNGGVRLASGDVNGDGTPDLIAAPGPGGGPDIRVFDRAHLNQANPHSDIIREFMAYSPYFTGGVYLAAGDVNGDGKTDIITGAGAGGGPQVSVFSGLDDSLLESFMAYSPYFNGGVRVGYALDSDGHGDILTAAGSGGGPHVQVLDGLSLTAMDSFYAYNPAFNGGVFIGGE